MIFVTGLSGSGKSVLLRLAMGLERPDSGQILIEGNDLGLLDEAELLNFRGTRMGMVFQEDSLFTGLTAYDNVAFRLDEHGVSQAETDEAVKEVLQFVGLEKDAEQLPEELSFCDSSKSALKPGAEEARLRTSPKELYEDLDSS